MSMVCKCDKCGRVFDPKNGVHRIISYNEMNLVGDHMPMCSMKKEEKYDLCDACSILFKTWISNKKGEKDEINQELVDSIRLSFAYMTEEETK